MPDPTPPCGRRNCNNCGAWRPVSDYWPAGDRVVRWCCICCRAAAEEYRAEQFELAQLEEAERARRREIVLRRAHRRVESGAAVWVEPFRAWCKTRAAAVGWQIVGDWAQMSERNLRRAVDDDALTISIDAVDRALLAEGFTTMDDLYPITDEKKGISHRGLVAA